MSIGDDEHKPVKGGFADAVRELRKGPLPSGEPEEPRDPAWLRWSKFGALILGLAVLFGGAFWCAGFLMESRSARTSTPQLTADNAKDDIEGRMRARFLIGAAIGGGLASMYVGRCVVKGVDP